MVEASQLVFPFGVLATVTDIATRTIVPRIQGPLLLRWLILQQAQLSLESGGPYCLRDW